MRWTAIAPAFLAVTLGSSALAQEWTDYIAKEDFFSVDFAAPPTIDTFTYTTEYGSTVPARRYTSIYGTGKYVMTVVHMNRTDRPAGGQGSELRGAIQYAATAIRRTGIVTTDIYNELQSIPGQILHVTLPDGKRIYASIYLHKHRLYILEATAPDDEPPPLLFQASLNIMDEQGRSVRYQDNEYSFPDGRPPAAGGGG